MPTASKFAQVIFIVEPENSSTDTAVRNFMLRKTIVLIVQYITAVIFLQLTR